MRHPIENQIPSVLSVLREHLTPYMQQMLSEDRVKNAPGGCSECGQGPSFKRTQDTGKGAGKCAACFCLSAKMPRHSDIGKPAIKQGISVIHGKGAGFGLLVTPTQLRFYAADILDVVFFDGAVTRDKTIRIGTREIAPQSIRDVLALPEGTLYWWGLLREGSPSPLLHTLLHTEWSIAQSFLEYRPSSKESPIEDTRESWAALGAMLAYENYYKSLLPLLRQAKALQNTDDQKDQEKKREAFLKKVNALTEEDRANLRHLHQLSPFALQTYF
ncbi:hypothetical protein B1757_12945 [Acidithiobacillus marinus]|uniref:Uncharacterized protein n=1 Tax=Acidithiobacillus marinus TaxID=187490 RepID=A0A2I1DJ07_9PROT|nr:hypothetical protein [Acidithiobacillus marinus]PKY09849.1 hypothetical protein B1757_12945 [Acidithiobacillus marinus]